MHTQPNHRALLMFIATAEQKTFSAAAHVLDVSQPTVSQQIAVLEKELGSRLFHRGGRALSLTPEGNALYAAVSAPLREIEFVWSDFRNRSAGKGRVVVASVHTLFSYFLPEALSRFSANHPGAYPDLRGRSSDEVIHMVETRQVELGLVYDTAHVSDKLASEPLFVEDIVAVYHPHAPWSEALETDGALRTTTPIISFQTGYALRSLMDRMTGHLPLNIVAEIDNTEMILSLVSNAKGVALLPRGFAERRTASNGLKWIPLSNPHFTRTVVAIWRSDEALHPLTRAFLETCQDRACIG